MPLAPGRSIVAGSLLLSVLLAAGCSPDTPPPPPPAPGVHLIDLLPADGQVGAWKQIDPPHHVDYRKDPASPAPTEAATAELIGPPALGRVRVAYGQQERGDRVVLIDIVEFSDKETADLTLGETVPWDAAEVRPAVETRPAEGGRPGVPGRPAVLRAQFVAAKAHLIVLVQTHRATADWVDDVKRLGEATVRNIHAAVPRPQGRQPFRPATPAPRPAETRPALPPTRPSPPPPATRPSPAPDDGLGPIVG